MSTETKQTLILLHGALGSSEQWSELKELLKEDFDVHTLNFSGHGGRECTEPFSIDLFEDDLDRYIRINNLGQVDLFGYSMGGYVALKYALDHSDRVGKIMTLGTKFNWTPESAANEMKMLDANLIAEKVPQFAKVLEERHAPLDWKGVVRNTAQMIHGLGNGNAIDFGSSSLQNEVLISVGDLDRVVKFGEAVAVANALYNGRFDPLSGAGHPLEQVPMSALAAKIRAFFEEGK